MTHARGHGRFAALLAIATVVVLAAGVTTVVQLSSAGDDEVTATAARDGLSRGAQAAGSPSATPRSDSGGRDTQGDDAAGDDAAGTGSGGSQPGRGVPDRGDDRFEQWVDDVAGWLDIPRRAMHSYATATTRLTEEQPACNLSWVTLAGIGRTASDHGRATGTRITDDGTPAEPIGTIELRNFDDEVVSQDGAAGPMQLSPAVWEKWAASASSRAPDIQNLDDAALTAGRALCADGRDLDQGQQWLAGVSALHDEPLFQHRVLATANVYGTVGMSGQRPDPKVVKAVTFAVEKIGLPYVWGGNGEEQGDQGFDCSGLTTAAYGSVGVPLQRTAHSQYSSVHLIGKDEQPRLGDLVFYGDPNTKIHHVGMYIGNQQMIDAPTFGQAVQVHNYRKPGDSYAGAGRPVA